MIKKRSTRQNAIRDIVRSKHIRTQKDIVTELKAQGYVCTQATVSRDIADMGLQKLSEGIYILAEDLHLQRMVSDLVLSLTVVNNMTIIKTSTGTAQGVAAALDAADLPGILGSLAGDDTILAIAESDERAQSFKAAIEKLRLK